MDLRGRVCVVTGASSGIGERVARDLATAGAVVCAAARREERLKALVAGLPGEGHAYKKTDVSDRAQVAALARFVDDAYGRCDVLINNAGFSINRDFTGPDAVGDLDAVMATNFFGVVVCTAEFLALLKRSAPSSVVNVASVAGRLATGAPAYTASKFAVVGWSEAVHFELAKHGVYVSLVEPGIIPTEGFPADAIAHSRLLRATMGTVEQVSDAILDAIAHRKLQRVVPRWYYLLQIPRVLVPPLYRFVQAKVVTPIYRRDRSSR